LVTPDCCYLYRGTLHSVVRKPALSVKKKIYSPKKQNFSKDLHRDKRLIRKDARMPDDEEPADADLAAQAASGDEHAFALLFDHYYNRIRAFAFRIVLDASVAEDVTQESFIRAARGIRGLQDSSTFQAWLYRICSNTARDALRAKRSHEAKLEFAARHLEISRDGRNGDAAGERALHLMQSLPPEQREAVALVFLEECTHAEAARLLGCAESTVSWRIHLAKRRLRKLVN
jgi:RNA polymerase sigma-70 factor, ECF subfamily